MRRRRRGARLALATAGSVVGLLGAAAPGMAAETVYGLTASDELVPFSSAKPGATGTPIPIAGKTAGDDIVGIDFRPATGQLYGIAKVGATDDGQLYRIDTVTGAATAIGAPGDAVIAGAQQGFDFNPFPDRVRVVNDEPDANWRLNPNNGARVDADVVSPGVQPDAPLAFSALDPNVGDDPDISSIAYTNSVAGAAATRLFALERGNNALVQLGPGNADPNNGTISTVGPLGVSIEASQPVGFDIFAGGPALASIVRAGETRPRLYSIDTSGPTAGATREIGRIGNATTGPIVQDIAIAPKLRTFVALTNASPQQLVTFRSDRPGVTSAPVPVTGLPGGVTLAGVDTRSANGTVYAAGSDSRLYTLDPASGAATPVIAGPFTPALTGTAFGFDFNPQADRLRITSNTDKNKRLNPVTGLSAVGASFDQDDTDLAYDAQDANTGANPNVVAAAYTSPVAGAANTTLFGIDTGLNTLVRQGAVDGAPASPNGGALFTIGALGVDATDTAGYDVVPELNAGFAALNPAATTDSNLYSVNAGGGTAAQAILIGRIGAPAGTLVQGLAFLNEDTISLGSATVTVAEDSARADIAVVRSTTSSDVPVSAQLKTADGTARAGSDYTAVDQTVTFGPGETVKTIAVPLTDDGAAEGPETVTVSLSPPAAGTNGAGIGTPSTATLTIADDEPVPPLPPVRVPVRYLVPVIVRVPVSAALQAFLGTAEEIRGRTLARKGLRAVLGCSARCTYRGTLSLDRRTARRLRIPARLSSVRGGLAGAGSRTLRLRPSRKSGRALRRSRRGRLIFRVRFTDAAGNSQTVSRRTALTG